MNGSCLGLFALISDALWRYFGLGHPVIGGDHVVRRISNGSSRRNVNEEGDMAGVHNRSEVATGYVNEVSYGRSVRPSVTVKLIMSSEVQINFETMELPFGVCGSIVSSSHEQVLTLEGLYGDLYEGLSDNYHFLCGSTRESYNITLWDPFSYATRSSIHGFNHIECVRVLISTDTLRRITASLGRVTYGIVVWRNEE